MVLNTESISEIKELREAFEEKARAIQSSERGSQSSTFESIVRNSVDKYSDLTAFPSSNRDETRYERAYQVAFLDTLGERGYLVKDEKMDLMESRLYSSELLALNYLIGCHEADRIVYETLKKEGKEMSDFAPEEISDMVAEVCVDFIKTMKEKDAEQEIYEKYPNAPSTGFEFEYSDPISHIASLRNRYPAEIQILEFMLEDPKTAAQKFFESGQGRYGTMQNFFFRHIGNNADYYREQITLRQSTLKTFEEMSTVLNETALGTPNKEDFVRQHPIDSLTAFLLKNPELSDEAREKFANLINFLGKTQVIEEGTVLTPSEMSLMVDLVPTMTTLMSYLGTFKDKHELDGREYISSPTISLKVQLRDMLLVLRQRGLQGEFATHQTVSNVELNEENTEFMEVYAIECGADLLCDEEVISEGMAHIIDENVAFTSESYKKPSVGKDGNKYYFPIHRARNTDSLAAVPYINDSHSFVEMRNVGLVNTEKDYIKFVKLTTFSWLAAWGASAAQKSESERTPDETFFAEQWATLMSGWDKLLEETGIEKPAPNEYFTKWEERDNYGAGMEKYTLYTYKIRLLNQRENTLVAEGKLDRKNTFAYKSYELVRNYRTAMHEKINQ